MRGYLRVFGGRELNRKSLALQAMWKPQIGEDDFCLSSFKSRKTNTWAHLLRKRGTLFHPPLFHRRRMQKRLKLRDFTWGEYVSQTHRNHSFSIHRKEGVSTAGAGGNLLDRDIRTI
jgi:hypothetical protein